jgi:hypothetical protein
MADVFFNSGVKAMVEGQFDIGCPDLAKSYQLDPKAGTLFALADCERQWGHLTAAMGHFGEYLKRMQGMSPDKREKYAQDIRLAKDYKAELLRDIPKLVIVLPAYVPSDARVLLNGTLLEPQTLDKALFVEPGNYLIRLEVEDAPPIEKKVRVEKGETKTIDLAPTATTPSQTSAIGSKGGPLLPQKLDDESSSSTAEGKSPINKIRVGAIVVAGVGLVGFGTWGVAGALALQHREKVQSECSETKNCSSSGLAAVRDGRYFSHVATVGLGVGVVGTAVSLVLLVSGNRQPKKSVATTNLERWFFQAQPDGGMVGVKGAF